MNQTTFSGELWPLTAREKEVLEDNISKQKNIWKWAIIAILIFAIILPFGLYKILDIAIKPDDYYTEKGAPIPQSFDLISAFIASGLMVLLFGIMTLKWIYIPLVDLKRDLKKNRKMKIIAPIVRKQFVAVNQSFFLHVYHKKAFTIEVNAHDFQRVNEGDEINLFYTPLSAIYLGYFITT